MARPPRVTLDQWRTLQAVVEYGGFAQAARRLHRSQSAVSYTIARLQEQLGVPLLRIEGRKARLTETGELLLQRSHHLLQEASNLEILAEQIAAGREAEINLVVDAAFPTSILMQALQRFATHSQGTRVQLKEVVLSGASDALLNDNTDLVIGTEVPKGCLADPLMRVEFVASAHPDHPLHQLGRPLSAEDLGNHIQIVIRDSGHLDPTDHGWLSIQQRWTVSSLDTALMAIEKGLGFCWLPVHRVSDAIRQGDIRILPLEQGQYYHADLYMIFAQPQNTGPATRELAEIIEEAVTQYVEL